MRGGSESGVQAGAEPMLAGASVRSIDNFLIKANLVITPASGWLERLVSWQFGHMRGRRRKTLTSEADSANHSPLRRLLANRLCQYASMPAGSSVRIRWMTSAGSGN